MKYVEGMAGDASQILALAGGKVIFQIERKGLWIHFVDGLAHEKGTAVRSDVVEACRGKERHQIVNILPADELKQILRLRFRGKGLRIEQPLPQISGNVDILSVEPFVQKTAVGYHIGGKKDAARSGDADRLAKGLSFILFGVKMVQRAKQQCDIVGAVRKSGQIQGIALCDRESVSSFLKNAAYRQRTGFQSGFFCRMRAVRKCSSILSASSLLSASLPVAVRTAMPCV